MTPRLLTPLFTLFCLNASAQSVCGMVNEGQTMTLTAPAGKVFTSVTFASYGTPNGSCGSFAIGTCDASNSQNIVETALLGNNSASINATNGTFGDPCVGTFKRLYVEAVYGTLLPLKIVSFTGSVQENFNLLKWETTDEQNTKEFDIERATDGIHFSQVAIIPANNTSGDNYYSFTDNARANENFFYRLKMVDLDGHYTYSITVKLSDRQNSQIIISPNPVRNLMTLQNIPGPGMIEVLNVQGKIIQRVYTNGPSQVINMANSSRGLYVLKYVGTGQTQLQKIIRQ